MFSKIQALSSILKPALDGLQARQSSIANNLANVDTPGFKGSHVAFEAGLQAQLRDRQSSSGSSLAGSYTHRNHLPLDFPEASSTERIMFESSIRHDQNNIDIDVEMTKMSETNVSYNAVSQMLAGRYSGLKYVITEGAR